MSKNLSKEAVAAAKTTVEVYGLPTRVILRVIFVILAVIAVLWIISKLTGIILLLILSIFFAYLVAPLVEFLRRPRHFGNRVVAIPKALAILLAYFILSASVVVAVYAILPSLGNQFPEFATQAKTYSTMPRSPNN